MTRHTLHQACHWILRFLAWWFTGTAGWQTLHAMNAGSYEWSWLVVVYLDCTRAQWTQSSSCACQQTREQNGEVACTDLENPKSTLFPAVARNTPVQIRMHLAVKYRYDDTTLCLDIHGIQDVTIMTCRHGWAWKQMNTSIMPILPEMTPCVIFAFVWAWEQVTKFKSIKEVTSLLQLSRKWWLLYNMSYSCT